MQYSKSLCDNVKRFNTQLQSNVIHENSIGEFVLAYVVCEGKADGKSSNWRTNGDKWEEIVLNISKTLFGNSKN